MSTAGRHPSALSSPAQLAGQGPVVFALGTFDGIHLGHQDVLAATRELASQRHALPAVLFFSPSPKAFFAPESATTLLPPAEAVELFLTRYGMAAVVQLPFDRALAALEPAEFLQRYFFGTPGLATVGFVVGEGWRFGAGNCGDTDLLARLAAAADAAVRVVPLRHDASGEAISSTRIRQLVAAGECAQASQLLGRPYTLAGTVGAGMHLATSRLDCPTANLEATGLQLPPYGVYAARTWLENANSPMDGIVYVGDAPTIRQAGATPIVELHLFDFTGNLYNRRIRVEPVRFLRPSIVFQSTEELRRQIQRDLQQARQALQTATEAKP